MIYSGGSRIFQAMGTNPDGGGAQHDTKMKELGPWSAFLASPKIDQ